MRSRPRTYAARGGALLVATLLASACGGASPRAASTVPEAPPIAPPSPACALAPATCRLLARVEGPVVLTTYFSDETPNTALRALTERYARAAPGRVTARAVSVEGERGDAEANASGLWQLAGVVVSSLGGGGTQLAPIAEDDGEAAVQYALGAALQAVSTPHVNIGVLAGHGGPTLTHGLETLARMLPHYTLREVDAHAPIPADLAAVLVLDPTDALGDDELAHLEEHVAAGRGLGVLGGTMTVDITVQPIAARPTGSRIGLLLGQWGVTLEENIVADARCGRVPMHTAGGIDIPVAYPPALIVPLTGDDAPDIVRGIDSVPLFFSSAIDTGAAFASRHGVVLMRSSEQSWSLSASSDGTVGLAIREPRQWSATMPSGGTRSFVVGVAEQDEVSGARVVVLGSATMARDEFLPQHGELSDAAIAMSAMPVVLDAVDWLAHDEDLIALRNGHTD